MMSCALCGSGNNRVLLITHDLHYHLTNEAFNLVQCGKCGLIYISPMPAREHLRDYYPDGYYNLAFKKIESLYCRIVDAAKIRSVTNYKKKGKLLDVGCGSGSFLLNMQKRGWQVYGVDTSIEACALVNDELKQNVFSSEIEGCHFPVAYFDVITLWHVLEHVYNPNQVLTEVNRILKKDGILIVEVPNIKNPVFKLTKEHYFALDIPRHLYHYTPKTLEHMLTKNGFVIRSRSFTSLGSPFNLLKSYSNILKYKCNVSQPWLRLLMPLLSPFLVILAALFRLVSLIIPSGETVQVHCVKMMKAE